ncbi:hypothetical protein HK100_008876 [Physocladia obscura]|uniref:Uncharacterized protein n=1 Tax=Physocladia obscura TaxID=109957 RepID=A0AAD5T9P1_9FUNG|nr:hypothetical protein HK100_008876 [Physocladia obscura]
MVVTGKKLMVDREGLEDTEVVLNALSDMDSGGMFYVTGFGETKGALGGMGNIYTDKIVACMFVGDSITITSGKKFADTLDDFEKWYKWAFERILCLERVKKETTRVALAAGGVFASNAK